VIAAIFAGIGKWLSATSQSPDVVASVLRIEKQIAWLYEVSTPFLKLGASLQLAILAFIVIVALAGATSTSTILSGSFSVYRKVARFAFVLLFFVSSFSFFQSNLVHEVGDIVAQLKTKSGDIAELNRKSVEKLEEAVLSTIAEEVARNDNFKDAYAKIGEALGKRDEWVGFNQKVARVTPRGFDDGEPPSPPHANQPGTPPRPRPGSSGSALRELTNS